MKLKISKSFFALIVLIQSATSKTQLSSADVGKFLFEYRSLSLAVLEIIRSLSDEASVLSIIKVTSQDVDAEKIDLFTETIAKGVDCLLELHTRDCDETTTMKQNALLVFANGMKIWEIEKFLLSLKFESHGKLLIVVLNKVSSDSSIKLMLDIMWLKFTLNVHVLTIALNDDVHLNTFFPYAKDWCGQVHPVVWNVYRNETFIMQREHFPQKNVNLYQCSLRVAVFNAPPYMLVFLSENGTIDVDGADGNMLETLAEQLNFVINYTIVSEDVRWGELYANQSATGAMAIVRSYSLVCC